MPATNGEFTGIRVARSSRALAKASRLRGLSKPRFREIARVSFCDGSGKFVLAGRQDQRSGRACYPEFALTLVLFWMLLLSAPLRAGEFDDANALYDAGKFGEAKQTYERLAGRGEWSANLFYNLGNAAFRMSAPGQAVLNYERALALDGTHTEARANLQWLREQTGAKMAPRQWWEYVYPILPGGVFAVTAAVAFWVGVFALVSRRYFGWASFAFLLAGYAGVGVWRADREAAMAIITGKETSAKLAPADRAGLAEPLPEGSRVRVLSERGEWIYCALPGGGRGWIAEPHLERVRLKKS